MNGDLSEQIGALIIIGAFYLLIIFGLVVLLIKVGASRRYAILLSCLAFGAVMGLLMTSLWLNESSIFINFPAAFLGDWIYQNSIQYIGDPFSPQAHYTIPWPLRVPQVYVLASLIFWGAVGALAQLVDNTVRQRKVID